MQMCTRCGSTEGSIRYSCVSYNVWGVETRITSPQKDMRVCERCHQEISEALSKVANDAIKMSMPTDVQTGTGIEDRLKRLEDQSVRIDEALSRVANMATLLERQFSDHVAFGKIQRLGKPKRK